MTNEEVVKQLVSLKCSQEEFIEEENDIFDKDIQAIDYAIEHLQENSIIDKLEEYLIKQIEKEETDAYDSEVEVSDAYIIYEKMLDKMKKLKEGIFDD